MPYQFVPYTLFLLVSAATTAALSVYGTKQRHNLGTNILGLCMAIGTVWSSANALELSALTLERKLFWANVQYAAYSLGPVAWFLTACQFTGRSHWLSRKGVLALLTIPTITICLVWTDPWWGLVRSSFELKPSGPLLVLGKQYGPWFWVHFAHSYSLNFCSILLLALTLNEKSSIYKRQAAFMLAGILLVVCTNLLFVLGLIPSQGFDVTPLVFSFAAGLMFWGIYSCELFRLVPIAWETVISSLDTAVVVVDNRGRVVEINPAFSHLLSQDGTRPLLGRALSELSPELALLGLGPAPPPGTHQEVRCRVGKGELFLEVLVSEIRGQRSTAQGRVITVNDITQLKTTQERLRLEQQELAIAAERARFTQDLHDNLGQILGFCTLQVQTIGRELERGQTEKADGYLSRLGEVLSQAQQEMRAYVHGLRAREYESTDLKTLLKKELDPLQEHQGYETVLDVCPGELPVETKIQLCSIVKEALNNVRKHAQATQVKICLAPAGGDWVLTVTDNGGGFDPVLDLEPRQRSSGLSIMEERARLLGGELKITSCPGRTVVRVQFPPKGVTSHANPHRR